MLGYEPVDLRAFCNAGQDAIDTRRVPPVGEQAFHGIPFRIGAPNGAADRCFIVLKPGADPITVPVGRVADRVIVAHRLLRNGGPESDPAPGAIVAEYAFRLADGSIERVAIRNRLEIAAAADEGWDSSSPFHTAGSNELVLFDRDQGPWQDAGSRQCETGYRGLPDYFLWVWENPTPTVPVDVVELVPGEARVLVAAITSSDAGEHPFAREAARTVRITAVDDDGLHPLGDPSVEVDRGSASYAFRLPAGGVEAFLEDALRGWGEDVDSNSPHAYTRIAAVPSATVTVRDGDRELGFFRWGDLTHDDPVESGGLRVEVVEQGRNWVHVTVLDDETGRPVPCRVHFRSPEGVPYQPHGHHDHVNSDLGTWHVDVGGDLRLGRVTYAYIDGTCQGWLPRGEVLVDIARGFEYEPLRERIRIDPGQRELVLHLKRWTSMNANGWYSGDSHVHFLSTQGSLLEQQGEDLNVVNLLQSQWGSLFTNTEDFTGGSASTADGRHVTWVSQENRQPFFGHMVLWGLSRPVMPWCSDAPNEADLAAWQETTMSDWADRAHEQGSTVVIPHFPQPNGEPVVLIATGRADAIEMIVQRPMQHAEYYAYLNAGYRLPLVGGTDKMSSEVPVGAYRTYAKLDDEPFSFDAWTRAVRNGRTFLSGGPILRFGVDGHDVGDTVRLSGPGTVSVDASAESVLPISSLELVRNGEVVASSVEPSPGRRLELRADIEIDDDSWLAARCGGPGYFDGPSQRDVWGRRIFAHTSPVYVTCGDGEWSRSDPDQDGRMLTLIEAGITRLRSGRAYPEDRVTHHHGELDHQAFLERPFVEARERVRARLASAHGTTGSEGDR
jgi:hypothetical protein